MLDPPDSAADRAADRAAPLRLDPELRGRAARVDGTPLEQALRRALDVTDRWRQRCIVPAEHVATGAATEAATNRWLLQVPDVGPACEAILADRLFHDLEPEEHQGLLAWIRGSQDESGAWLDADGNPDLSLTVLGWWARAQAGDDLDSESMIRARRVVHALGGAQRANFQVRLWLAMGGAIPWDFLPAIPGELFLLPSPTWLSPSTFSPWARGVLTPYYVIARAPARLQLTDATPLLLQRNADATVAPRLTRPGLAGDLLQAFDRTIKLSRKFPRGPVPRWATERAGRSLDATQQRHGGWFSTRPTLLSLIALRVMGVTSDDPRLRAGLAYLRRSRGLARIRYGRDAGSIALAQGLGTQPLSIAVRLLQAHPADGDARWLLREELTDEGPWQRRADASAGGWPREPGAHQHLDLQATCDALETLSNLPRASHTASAWAAARRATEVVLAMQEADGGFSRFERGEARVFMRRFPWTDADLLAFGQPSDRAHVRLTAAALHQLGHIGLRLDDDRVARGIDWLQRTVADEHDHRDVETLATLVSATHVVCPTDHALHREAERRLRSRQREDGSFGSLVETAAALRALCMLGAPCVQAVRAARQLVGAVQRAGEGFEHAGAVRPDGLGLSPTSFDPSAGAREAALALHAFADSGKRL